MLNDQIFRLRKGFRMADDLAEELYTMFLNVNDPLQSGQASQWTMGDELQAPLQITNAPIADTAFDINTIRRPDGSGFNIGIDADNRLIFQAVDSNGNATDGEINGIRRGGGGGVLSDFLGIITGNSGVNSYTVDVYLSGPSRDPTSVTATQWNSFATAATPLANGTKVFVLRTLDGGYYINEAKWRQP